VKNLNRKINDLENSVLQEQAVGSTKLCSCAWPIAEQELLEKARQISELGLTFEETTPQQRLILEKAGDILRFRVFDIFTIYLEGVFCRDDHGARINMHERFLWFIQELRKETAQLLEVSEIEKNASPNSEVDEVDEYFRKAPKLFTEKSWYAVQDDLTQRWVEHMKKTGKWKELMKKLKVKP
jgi:hypothetical protein